MSTTSMLTSNALAVKLWSKKAYLDMYKSTSFGRAMSRGTIMKAEELNTAKAGDQVTFNFTGILTGQGVGEGGTLVGNEEALNLSSYAMTIGMFRHGVNNPNTDTIEQQRTYVPFEKEARDLLPEYHAARLDAGMFNQLAGVNSTTITIDGTTYAGGNRTFVQGLNTIVAPSTNRIVRAGGETTDEGLGSTETMTLDLIDAAVELAATTYPTIRPLDNQEFDLYLHPYQILDLKRDVSGKIQWYINAIGAAAGGDSSQITDTTVLGQKPMGKYANVNILSSYRVSNGQNSSTSAAITTVKRGVLCGKNACAFGSPWGGTIDDEDVPFKFFTQLQDYDYYKGIEARMLYGLKKIQMTSAGNTEDLGSVVISTYAAAHTS
ncbi:MAG: DUF4043 family protein [Pseudomonadota bacterium]